MKRNKILLLGILLLSACGGNENSVNNDSINSTNSTPISPISSSVSSENQIKKVTVKFINTDLDDVVLDEGSSLNQPNDPSKANHIFGGWYYDASFKNEVKFPIIVNNDISIYALFNDYESAFLKAREKTIGNNAEGFKYNFTTTASATYSLLNVTGQTIGTAQYAKDKDVSYYETHTNSGLLFNDGTKHLFKDELLLTNISFNEKNELTNFESEYVDSSYKYDSSSFAKALFELDDEKIKSIEKTDVEDTYKINTSMLASNILSIILNNLNNPIVERLLATLPETAANTEMYTTFKNGYVESYKYVMEINVTDLTFNLTYELNFVDYTSKEIVLPKFEGLAISSSELSSKVSSINTSVNNYKNQVNSSYDFKVDTSVNFDGSNSIDATFKGNTLRKVDDNEVYFNNDIQIDSDLKNSDLYKDDGLEDIHINKTKALDGTVEIIEKKLLKDKVYESEETKEDAYYLFDVLDFIPNAQCIQTVSKDNVTNEYVSLNTENIAIVLEWFNNILKVDPTGVTSKNIKVLGTINNSTLKINECLFNIEKTNNEITSITFELHAEADVKYEGSKDFTSYAFANIDVTLSIDVTDDGASYEPAE